MTTPSENLCLACGLCCDGTLFSWVVLRPADDVPRLAEAGVAAETVNGRQGLWQPCAGHHAGRCTVYQVRPCACATFRCKLLRRQEAGEIAPDQARAVVERARQFRDIVRAHTGSARSGTSLRAAFWEAWKIAEATATPAVRISFAALQWILDREFRDAPASSDEPLV